MKIRELDSHLINKIAAGEVIERPASIIKELVENSIDAQSTQIEILVEAGGTGRICVIDNGIGMSADELSLAIKRHTTSKIAHEDDLNAIKTLGFRGEALASIMEVSRTKIASRDHDSSDGIEIEVEGGVVQSTRSVGCKIGTKIDVRDLFFNTPARRKFLKSEKTEYTHILRMVKRFVLAYPQIHFKLLHKDRTALESTSSQNLRDVIAHLYANELAKSLIEVSAESNSIKITGLIAPPDKNRHDRTEQHLFVNGRAIRDNSLNYAIGRAYEGFLHAGRFPITFLKIQINPDMIDVNVHPKKEEVRFSNISLVQSELKRAVSNALLSHGVIPTLRDPKSHEATKFGQSSAQTQHQTQHPSRLSQTRPTGAHAGGQFNLTTEWAERAKRGSGEIERRESREPVDVNGTERPFRVIGQLHGTYILVQTEEGIEMIDQHVAHERILYEKFLRQLSEGVIAQQKLLIPMTLKLPADEAQSLERNLSLLEEQLGIGIEPFGNGTFILRDWPESLAKDLTQERVIETLQRVLDVIENEDQIDAAPLAKELAADLACKGAVVKNTPLTREEMERLVLQLKDLDNPYRCPHGRPITVSYSLVDLEKAFGRRK